MPRVFCSICGAAYQYEVYDGVCPKCGAFNQPGDTGRPVTPLWEREAAAQPAAQRAAAPGSTKPALFWRWPGLLLCVTLAVLLAASGAAAGIFYRDHQRAALINTPLEVVSETPGTEMALTRGFSLSFGQAAFLPPSENASLFPAGYQAVSLPFYSQWQDEDVLFSDLPSFSYTYYARLEDGACIYAESFYRLSAILPGLSLSAEEPQNALFAGKAEGQFIFFLPENTQRFTFCAEETDDYSGLVVKRYEYAVTVKGAGQ